jgi:hypothetical protein
VLASGKASVHAELEPAPALPGVVDCVTGCLLFWVEQMRPDVMALLLAGVFAGLAPAMPASGQTPPASSLVGNADSIPIGKVVMAAGSITVERATAVVAQVNLPAGDARTKVGDLVYRGDVVQTGADGKLGITFNDGTAFNLSSNARMVLNEFVYDPNGSSNSTFFSLSKGTFTFIAGKVAKTGDMKIDTPVATMGIRGTTPHIKISEDGSVAFSTLIEEGKSGGVERRAGVDEKKPVAPANRRQAKRASSPDTSFNINFKICQGC